MLLKKDKGEKLFFKEAMFKVAELVFTYPNRTFHLREIAQETHFSTTAISQALSSLSALKIIATEETKLTKNVKADIDSEAYRFYKSILNVYRIKHYMFFDFLITKFQNPQTIVLFGSFARGEDIEKSDIDILIITPNKYSFEKKELNTYEKAFHRTINIHILPSLEKSEASFKNAVANGIVLHGYVKVV